MKPSRRLLTTVMTLALGLGVWSLAVSFTSSNFSAGDQLSASELNSLLNSNFSAATDAIGDLETDLAALDADVTDLGSDVEALQAGKLDKAGGTVTGRLNVSGAASGSGASTVFHVSNSGSTGSAAVFTSDNASDNGTVSIKQQGTGPALTLKSNGGGPIITGAGALNVTFVVEENGSIRIGNMGTSGTGTPTLRLDAEAGTIANNVGSGLPLAFGSVSSAGEKLSGTSNWTASVAGTGTTFYITIDGESYNTNDFTAVANPKGSNNAVSITSSAAGTGTSGIAAFSPRNAAGTRVADGFSFVIYKAAN